MTIGYCQFCLRIQFSIRLHLSPNLCEEIRPMPPLLFCFSVLPSDGGRSLLVPRLPTPGEPSNLPTPPFPPPIVSGLWGAGCLFGDLDQTGNVRFRHLVVGIGMFKCPARFNGFKNIHRFEGDETGAIIQFR